MLLAKTQKPLLLFLLASQVLKKHLIKLSKKKNVLLHCRMLLVILNIFHFSSVTKNM
ncbi:hypothetical protein JCM19237_1842 [Photobacterium aphoticum]|uniref:Uncharacterized protein n=1 Tax=Photobacterium aphoticum TaxID=754436 RepID=A0A090RF57_9GAMM|nr:hypothetical protein JCM19237_1842 [Photobacterium aphoticum]